MINSQLFTEELDSEWIQLINEAKNIGMNLQEVRAFLRSEKDYLIQENPK
ncbi:anti-repressor SinI family protein [Niallia sp. Sow4_A1]|uniref:Anti-repressor SinI family protein n=1 Tax=Niallia hominis TaxID=3133173 RepID=A0ABV1EU38_9BACI|nr:MULTISPECIES: anti-repressor SinI family protein [Bacillaceae]MCM3361145.1 anti-repressor SinI family protein [Niallia sp. MER TA 168]